MNAPQFPFRRGTRTGHRTSGYIAIGPLCSCSDPHDTFSDKAPLPAISPVTGITKNVVNEEIQCFERLPGMDPDEFERTVKMTERAINRTPLETFRTRRELINKVGAAALRDKSLQRRARRRHLEEYSRAYAFLAELYQQAYPRLSQEEAAASVAREARRLHLEHRLDTAAMGDPNDFGGLGDNTINMHVWQQWSQGRLDTLKALIDKAAAANHAYFVTLSVCSHK